MGALSLSMRPISVPDPENSRALLQQEINRHQDARYDHRLHCVSLVAAGVSCEQVAGYFGDSPRSVVNWVRRFQQHGLGGLAEGNRYPLQVEMDGDMLQPLNWPEPVPDWPSACITNLVYDVARFAGREGTLAFSGPFGQTDPMSGNLSAEARIDGIQFVTAAAPLQFRRTGGQLVFAWPASVLGYALQSAVRLGSCAAWRNVDITPARLGDQQGVTLDMDSTNRAVFFRLGLIPTGLPPPDYGVETVGSILLFP
jgi:Homeodomain-like domain